MSKAQEKTIRLSDKQIKVIKYLQGGWRLTGTYYWEINGEVIHHATIYGLVAKGLIIYSSKTNTYFELTELGRTINIEGW